ncbi:MAG TPA: S24 family peptidase [Synergistales bacterium]|nr:S24 family peptidase [Synergistales bacterium]
MITTGFPSPASDFEEKDPDLNRLLIKNPSSTFFLRARVLSVTSLPVRDRDILIVDRSLEPSEGDLFIVPQDGSLRLKYMDHLSARSSQRDEGECWGVVTWIIHSSKG